MNNRLNLTRPNSNSDTTYQENIKKYIVLLVAFVNPWGCYTIRDKGHKPTGMMHQNDITDAFDVETNSSNDEIHDQMTCWQTKCHFSWSFFGGVVPLTGNVVSRLRSIKVKAGIDPTSVIAGKNKRQQQYQPTNKQTNKHFLHKNCPCLDQSAFPVRCHFLVFNYSFDVSLSFVPVCNMIADPGSIFLVDSLSMVAR